MSNHEKIPNIDFRRVIKFASTFSYFSSLARSHQSKTNISETSLSTCSIFLQSVHKVKTNLSSWREDLLSGPDSSKTEMFIKVNAKPIF